MNSENNRETTLNDNRYFISASAGTGKTTRLLQNVMIDLLKRGQLSAQASIRESLIVTFTVAAAAELRAKLNRNLKFAIEYAHSYAASGDKRLHDIDYLIGGDNGELARMIAHEPQLAATVFSKAVNELPTAQISTIDALSKHIVDRNADILNIDPGYQILTDEAIRDGMQRTIINDLFEQWYAPGNLEHDAFLDLLDNTGGALKDADLASEILRLYDQAQTKPNGLEWLATLSQPYQVRFAEAKPLRGSSWIVDAFVDEQHEKLEQLRQQTADMLSTFGEARGDTRNGTRLLHDSAVFHAMFAALDDAYAACGTGTWDDVIHCLDQTDSIMDKVKTKPHAKPGENPLYTNLDFRRIAVIPDVFADIIKGTADNNIAMNALKNICGHVKMLRSVFALPAKHMDALDAVAQRRIDTLVHLTELFAERYDAEKRRVAVQDFSDIAHLALHALSDDEVRKRVSDQWRYVYVDECQDNNALQNTFIDMIGKDAAKVTMVGDVKQSIYGFRYAQPDEFRRKSHEVPQTHLSTLTVNHRSTPEILIFVNTVFDHLMREDMGGADYLHDRFHIATSPERYDASAVEILLRQQLEAGAGDDDEPGNSHAEAKDDSRATPTAVILQRTGKDQQQVDAIVRRIRCLHDVEGYQYGDIAVLERSTKLFADLYDSLTEAGIPVVSNGVGDYYRKPEIAIALDWLKAIDNPHRDIPLIALLRAYGISDNTLAAMRLLNYGSYYGILYRISHPSDDFPLPEPLPGSLAEHTEELRAFLSQLESLRSFAATHPIDELLWHIYTQTGWYDYCGRLPEGHQRQANLAQLCVKARTFADTGERGLPAFLSAVEQWQANTGKDVNAEATTLSTKDAVQLTTIHKAKGLQWKVVILADATSATFHTAQPQYMTLQDPNDATHGIAVCRVADEHSQSIVNTFQRTRLFNVVKRQTIDEQLRLLYVALTRPESKLIIAGVSKHDLDEMLKATSAQTVRDDGAVMADNLIKDDGYMDWILKALYVASLHTSAHGEDEFMVNIDDPAKKWDESDQYDQSSGHAGSLPTGFLPVPNGLAADTDAGNASDRRITLLYDMDDVLTANHRNVASSGNADDDMITKRPSVEGFVSVADRVPNEQRRPLTLNASGIRTWVQAISPDDAADDADTDGIMGDALAAGNADEHSWRFAAYPLPDFLASYGSGPSAAEIGTGVHNVLELFDWATPADEAACAKHLHAVIQRLERSQTISKSTARTISEGSLFEGMMWFVCPTGRTADTDMSDASVADDNGAWLPDSIRAHRDRLFREVPFSLLLGDQELRNIVEGSDNTGYSTLEIHTESHRNPQDNHLAADGIVIRSVIDGYYIDDESRSIVLFDYKTDAVNNDEQADLGLWAHRLQRDYSGQQKLYATALERLYPGYTVTQRWLIGLAGHRFINVADRC